MPPYLMIDYLFVHVVEIEGAQVSSISDNRLDVLIGRSIVETE